MTATDAMQYSPFNDPALDALVEDSLNEFHAPGLAVMVVHRDRIWAQGWGYSDLEKKTPVTPETLFFAGSTTKSFTASLAAHLVESDEYPHVHWQTPVAQLIPGDFVLDPSSSSGRWATGHVTVEDCLCHRTGLPRHDLVWVTGAVESSRDVVRALRDLPMHRDMRTKFEYCNNTYTAVSHAIEKVLDQPFKTSLSEHIFEPLQMNHTTYDIEDARRVAKDNNIPFATSYLWNADRQHHEAVPAGDIPPSLGAGGIISNVLDYSKWVRHLMNPTGFTPALSSQAVKALRTPHMLVEPGQPYVGPQAYGLGLYSQIYRGKEVLDHGGAIAGYMANMTMVPEGAWAVVTMTNSYSAAHDVINWYLLDKFLGTPEEERFDVAKRAREGQARAEEALRPEKVVERLYGPSAGEARLKPALPIGAYAGLYEHPAYRQFQVSALSDSSLQLAPPKSARAYLTLAARLHHVNGEWWWAHQTTGPSSWITDKALKVQFVIDASGKVEGMRYQAEAEMPEELAFFNKIA